MILERLLILRPGGAREAAFSAGILPAVRTALNAARIIWVMDGEAGALIEKSPLVDEFIFVDRMRLETDAAYRDGILGKIASVGADAALNLDRTRDARMDALASASQAKSRVAFYAGGGETGDYHHVVENRWPRNSELADLRGYLNHVGIPAGRLSPTIWTTPEDAEFAARIYRENGLKPGQVILTGASMPAIDDAVKLEFLGEMTPRQTAEVLRRCRLFVGAETESVATSVAAALRVPSVIVTGGGEFGRWVPCGSEMSVVCVPLSCFGCGWNCRYAQKHCLTGISADVVRAAVEQSLAARSEKPRIFLQDRSMWQEEAGKPNWAWFHQLVARGEVELIALGRGKRHRTLTPLRISSRHGHETAGEQAQALRDKRHGAAMACLECLPKDLAWKFLSELAAVMDSPGLRELSARSDELPLLDEILAGIGRGVEGGPVPLANYLAAAMYFFMPHELHSTPAPADLPLWIRYPYIRWSLAMPQFFSEVGEAARYGRWLEQWLELLCAEVVDGQGVSELHRDQRDSMLGLIAHSIQLLQSYFQPGDMLATARSRARLIEAAMRGTGFELDYEFSPGRSPGRIRLGIVAGHFGHHKETYASIPFFEHLDRQKYEVHLYAVQSNDEELERWCRMRVDRFTVLPPDIDEAVRRLRENDLDLVHIATNMCAGSYPLVLLAAHRLARVQITSCCSPISPAFSHVDAYLAGLGLRTPADAQAGYAEKLVVIEEPGMCLRIPVRPPPSGNTRSLEAAPGAPKPIVYISGANFFKIIPELRRTWIRILSRTPNSALVLYPFGPSWSESYMFDSVARNFAEICREHGVDPVRVHVLMPMPSPSDIPGLLKQADVYLDSFPYAGALSVNDALEAHLPVVVMSGGPQRFGQAAQMLRSVGMDDLIALNEEAYVSLAVELGTSPQRRAAVRRRIDQSMQRSPRIFDSRWFASQLDVAFTRLICRL